VRKMKFEIVDGLMHVEGCKEPFMQRVMRSLCIEVSNPTIISRYEIEYETPAKRYSLIKGKGKLSKDQIAIAGYSSSKTDTISVDILPVLETDEPLYWNAHIGFLPCDREFRDDDDHFYLTCCIPESAYTDLATAFTYSTSTVQSIMLDISDSMLWVNTFDEYSRKVVWYMPPSRRDERGIDKQINTKLARFSWSVGAKAAKTIADDKDL
jgi:hypothetical protein